MALLYKYKDGKKLTGDSTTDLLRAEKTVEEPSMLAQKKVNLYPTGVAPQDRSNFYTWNEDINFSNDPEEYMKMGGIGANFDTGKNIDFFTQLMKTKEYGSADTEDGRIDYSYPVSNNTYRLSANQALPKGLGAVGVTGEVTALNVADGAYKELKPDLYLKYGLRKDLPIKNGNINIGGDISRSSKNTIIGANANIEKYLGDKLSLNANAFYSKFNNDKPYYNVGLGMKYNF
jgi:hypothetical protein